MAEHEIFELVKKMTDNLKQKLSIFVCCSITFRIAVALDEDISSIYVLGDNIIEETFTLNFAKKTCNLYVEVKTLSLTNRKYCWGDDSTKKYENLVIRGQLDTIAEWLKSPDLQQINPENGKIIRLVNR